MADKAHAPTKHAWRDYVFVTAADRLVIRIPLFGYVAFAGLYLLTVLAELAMAEVGWMDRESLPVLLSMMTAGVVLILLLWGRWWTLDRGADAVRYFPWRLCKVSAVRGVRVVERRTGKRNLGRAFAVDLDLEGGARVRFAGFVYAPLWLREEALVLATVLGDWLNVPVSQDYLSPAA
jgi:hypothetical protein